MIQNVQDIAQLVKITRKEQGLTQMKLAQLCNVGTRFVIDLEKGKPTCEIGKVLTLLHGLGIRLSHD